MKKHCIFTKTVRYLWNLGNHSREFLFFIFPETAVLIQITFFYTCFIQKVGLSLFDVEPSRTSNGAFCFRYTVKRENILPSIFNPYHLEYKHTTFWKCHCTLNTSPPEKKTSIDLIYENRCKTVKRHN